MNEVLRRNDPPFPPHEDQEGWLYIRVKRHPSGWGPTLPDLVSGLSFRSQHRIEHDGSPHRYVDSCDESRIISSARVERAVENDDIFRLCAERGLKVYYNPESILPWNVYQTSGSDVDGETLREAYERYLVASTERAIAARRNFR